MLNEPKYPNDIARVKKIKKFIFLNGNSNDELDELIDPRAIIKSPANFDSLTGRIGLYTTISYWKKAFTYQKVQWVSVDEKDDVVTIQWKADATHTGDDFFGIKAGNLFLTYGGKTMYRFKNNKLVYYEAEVDVEDIKKKLQTTPVCSPKCT